MNFIYGLVFKSEDGEEFGIIRRAQEPFPKELCQAIVLAEDESGNYFLESDGQIFFWDHETCERRLLSHSIEKFKSMCGAAEQVKLAEGQIVSTWIDPEFAKEHDIKIKH